MRCNRFYKKILISILFHQLMVVVYIIANQGEIGDDKVSSGHNFPFSN